MKLNSPTLSPFFTAYDSGAGTGGTGMGQSSPAGGTGAGSGNSGTGGAGSGGGTGAGGTGSGTGSGTAYKLSDDALVDLGDGKAVKWGEARSSRYVPKEDHERYVSTFQQAKPLLESYARQLDEGFARLKAAEAAAQRGGAAGAKARRDIADEIGELPLLKGEDGARLVRALREEGLAPIAQMVTNQQAQIKALTDQLAGVRSATGTVYEGHQNQVFEQHITTNLKELGEVKGVGTLDVNNPVVREIAKDLWGAYDPKTWTVNEYRRMLKERIEGIVQLVTTSQQATLKAAKEQKRAAFFNPNRGAGQPNGVPSYKHLDGLALARESGIFDRAA